jgi:hypothetical protein
LAHDVIDHEELPNPLDIFFVETEEWVGQIMAIEGSLIYKI